MKGSDKGGDGGFNLYVLPTRERPEADPRELRLDEAIQNATVLELDEKRRAVRFKQLMFFVGAGAIADPDDPHSLGKFGYIVLHFLYEMVDLIGQDPALLKKFQNNSKVVEGCNALVARAIVDGVKMPAATVTLLESIGAYPNEDDIAAAREKMRPKSMYERDREDAESIARKLLELLYPNGEKPKISYFDIVEMMSSCAKIRKAQDSKDANPVEKEIPREWLVTNMQSAILRRPDSEEDVWRIFDFVAQRMNILEPNDIRDQVLDRFGRPNASRARRNAYKFIQWFSYLANPGRGGRSEEEVFGWMLDAYRRDFEGKNHVYGEQFGYIYWDTLKGCMERWNKPRADVVDQDADDADTAQDFVNEKIILDDFLFRRIALYFERHGVQVPKK